MRKIYKQLTLMDCQSLTCCVGDFLANLLALLEEDEGLKTLEAHSFLTSQGFYKLEDQDVLYSKMWKGYLITTIETLSSPFLESYGNWVMTRKEKLLIANDLFPKQEGELSLSGILEEKVGNQYYLKGKALRNTLRAIME